VLTACSSSPGAVDSVCRQLEGDCQDLQLVASELEQKLGLRFGEYTVVCASCRLDERGHASTAGVIALESGYVHWSTYYSSEQQTSTYSLAHCAEFIGPVVETSRERVRSAVCRHVADYQLPCDEPGPRCVQGWDFYDNSEQLWEACMAAENRPSVQVAGGAFTAVTDLHEPCALGLR
jgi:hypothetical protein